MKTFFENSVIVNRNNLCLGLFSDFVFCYRCRLTKQNSFYSLRWYTQLDCFMEFFESCQMAIN